MQTLRTMLGTAALSLLLTATADARILVTPAVRVFAGNPLSCLVGNFSGKPQTVKVEALNAFTNVPLTSTSAPLDPNKFTGVVVTFGAEYYISCRFTVDGPKAKFRATIANDATGVGFPAQ